MVKPIVTIRDAKSDAVVAVMTHLATEADAIRAFGDVALRDGPIKSHPEDYSLWLVGTYDCTTGQLYPADHVTQIADAGSLANG